MILVPERDVGRLSRTEKRVQTYFGIRNIQPTTYWFASSSQLRGLECERLHQWRIVSQPSVLALTNPSIIADSEAILQLLTHFSCGFLSARRD